MLYSVPHRAFRFERSGMSIGVVICVAALALLLGDLDVAAADEASKADFFESRIRPVLVAKCYECHASDADDVGGELLLDARDHLRAGGESGDAIVPGDPDASLLMAAIKYEDLEMPPSGKLPDRVIADFRHWIETGAYDPRESLGPVARKPDEIDIQAGRDFWAFQQPVLHPTPAVDDPVWVQRKVDAFILAGLERSGLQPAPQAERRTLVRRLYFDLIGLPPRPVEVESFLADQRSDAYESLVDRLLASPRFGERWSRLWMDVARYAEDQAHIVGDNDSLFYPNAYLYRDWLVNAFNSDVPFDQFARLQLAADLFEPDSTGNHAALGFLGLGPKYYRRSAPEVMADEWEDRVDTVTRGLLGLTVACARCHDHKYDPISTEDYYALAGVFASTQMFNKPFASAETDDKGQAKKASEAVHIVREGTGRNIPVYIRGDATRPGDVVPRRFLEVLCEQEVPLQEGSGRRQLAEAIACSENPLTARVIVNRIWGEHFGRPLVPTVSNFGNLGQRPSHPELLDDLAVRFVQSGWSLKWLHREILLSAAYQQSSIADPATEAADPENRLIGRMNRRRLSIEQWRDAMLSVTGELEDSIGGKSFDVSDPSGRRRSLYARVSRLELDHVLQMFDHPDPNVHAASRSETTTPLQKLFVLNSQFMVQRAKRFVQRLDVELPLVDQATRIHEMYRLCFGRPPVAEESGLARDFLAGGGRWPELAQAMLGSNEMLFLD